MTPWTLLWVCADWTGTLTCTDPLLNPMVAAPRALNVIDRASRVVELFCVVFPVAKSPIVWFVCAAGSAADRLMVRPFEALAVDPLRFVRASVGSPWLWPDSAAVVRNGETSGTV